MRFKKNVSAELRAILREQLHKYKRENKDITEEEMKELEDWVAAGNSPYDNPYNGYREDGWPLDFISTIRDIEEENRWFESLSEEEKEELRHPKPSSTFEELDLDACLAE